MSGFSMAGLRPDQGPPLSIPMSFFLTAPVALTIAGASVMFLAGEGLDSIWSGSTVALVHLGTVGLLLAVMLGALYQMLPVVAGAVVPAVRLAHAVHALLVAGAGCLVFAQAMSSAFAFAAATALLAIALGLFWGPAALALARSQTRSATVWGMRLAFVGLAAVAVIGLKLAFVRSGAGYHPSWLSWRHAHAHLGLIAWVGCLIGAISWQVLPMFYLAAQPPRWMPRAVQLGVGVSVAGLLAVYFSDSPAWTVPLAALPGAVSVWGIHPLAVVRMLRGRRRRRADPSLRFWWLSMGCAPLCLLAGVAASLSDAPQLPVAYGFLALWGWAAAVVHGMLTRIVPFLVWFHRCAPLVGRVEVPSTRELLPDRAVARGFWLHLGTLLAGGLAIGSGEAWLWRALGLGLALTGTHLGASLIGALARSPSPSSGQGAAPVPSGGS
ncbi:MAG: hypothetical protein HYZ28_27810 [Myxococcales bacterium]|nr:hypothetical protein [Myxococcales bacterium]